MYCWSPADELWASTVAGRSRAAAAATIRQTMSLRGIRSGEVLHPAEERELAPRKPRPLTALLRSGERPRVLPAAHVAERSDDEVADGRRAAKRT